MPDPLPPEEIVAAALEAWRALPGDERNGERPFIMGFNAGWDEALKAAAYIETLEARVAEAREALKPFAEWDDEDIAGLPDDHWIGSPQFCIQIRAVRKASQWLKQGDGSA